MAPIQLLLWHRQRVTIDISSTVPIFELGETSNITTILILKEDRGVMSVTITTRFQSEIGRSPSIIDSGGRVFAVRFIQTLNGGILFNGWSSFITENYLNNNSKVVLK